MFLKLYSNLLILAVLALSLSTVVDSKPAFRPRRLGHPRPVAAENLKPLKQFNWRASKRATLATEPKPSTTTKAAFAMPAKATATVPVPTDTSDMVAAMPVARAIADSPAARSVDTEAEDIENALGTSSRNENTLNGLSSSSTNFKVPSVSDADMFPASGTVGVDSTDHSVHLPASDNVGTPFDHYIALNNRREEMDGSDSMDGGHDERT